MEDGIDSKKGRPQLQTEGKERETTLRFSPQIIAFYSDIGEKEHRNSRTPARLQGSKYKKAVFLLGEHKKNAISEQETALCFASVSRMD